VLTLVDIGVALVYTLLVVVHYYVVVKAWRYLRDERRAERTVVPARVHPAAGNGGGNGPPTAGGGPNIQRFP
jgi:hypothetical protein